MAVITLMVVRLRCLDKEPLMVSRIRERHEIDDEGVWLPWRRQRLWPWLLVMVVTATLLNGCSTGPQQIRAHILVTPASALLDSPVSISITGVPVGAHLELDAATLDAQADPWHSSAQFIAGGSGTVSTAQPSIGGSYTGVDPMGLFVLMRPVVTAVSDILLINPRLNQIVTLTARLAGVTIATTSMTRITLGPAGVSDETLELPRDGIFGELFLPKRHDGRHPAVLLVGGSEGGLAGPAFNAGILAEEGIPALALAYFGEDGLPASLRTIPLEYFAKALTLLSRQPGVDPSRLVMWGVSRGSEAAMLTAIHFPHLVHAVIAGSPASLVHGSYPLPGAPAWTLNGKPLPYTPHHAPGQPLPRAAVEVAVEQINAPLVTICGDLDAVWPSCPSSASITGRRAAHHTPYRDLALRYPAAGHSVGAATCYYSTTTTPGAHSMGGTVEANALASADAHAKVLAFLRGL